MILEYIYAEGFSNIKMQKTERHIVLSSQNGTSASDLGVSSILNGWAGTKLDELPPQSIKY
jgi:hypothetical protein